MRCSQKRESPLRLTKIVAFFDALLVFQPHNPQAVTLTIHAFFFTNLALWADTMTQTASASLLPGRLQSKLLSGPALTQALAVGRFSEITYWPKIHLESKLLSGPALAGAPVVLPAAFENQNMGPNLPQSFGQGVTPEVHEGPGLASIALGYLSFSCPLR